MENNTFPIEPERYELSEDPFYRFEVDRRDFFKLLGAGILVIGVMDADAQDRRGQSGPQEVSARLHIGVDGRITAYTGKVEVGQNARTSLTLAVAEELRVPPSSITLVMADTDVCPNDGGTAGSRTTPDTVPQMRKVAATAREVLLDRAAQALNADRSRIEMADGKLTDGTRSITIAELAKDQSLLKTVRVGDAALTQPSAWRVLGKQASKVDGTDFVTGKHRFTSDRKLDGMLHGKIVRPAGFGGMLASADTAEAERLPGVTVVRDGNLLGIVAPDSHTASSAAAKVKANWRTSDQLSEAELFKLFKARGEQKNDSTKGSIEEGLSGADRRLSGSYTVAYIAHAPMEPRAAVADWQGGKLTVWTGTQQPLRVRRELAEAFGIAENRVRVIVPDTGSGYGGKHTGETAVEAARLAKAAGKPVQVVWSREEEFTWAYFRPAGLIEVQSGFRNDGSFVAWDFHNYNSGGSSIAPLYEIPHQRVHFHRTESPLRQGSYRGLAATANHFAREVHIDEIAHTLNKDPLELRLQNLKNERLRAVLQAAAEKFGWSNRKAAVGRGFGIAGGFEKGSYVATCAEVSADKDLKHVKVERTVTAYECGAVLNPNQLRNQIEGAIVMGLGGALTEAIHFENGRVLNPHFSKYRVPRMADTPVIEIVLVDRKDLPPVGAGETPIVGIAPAVSAAIFEATGKRLRSLPMLG